MLSFRDVAVRFGGIRALDGVSFDVPADEVVALVGPNGAGKTTAFNVITRVVRPEAGEVELEGESLLAVPPYGVVRRGVARTFEDVELFASLSVLENVQVGAHARQGPLGARELLDYVGLGAVAERPAGSLPYGTRKRVETARALASGPRLLLLDEPAGGLNHEEVEELAGFLRRLREDFALTLLLVEHHMGLVGAVADRVHVLDFGRLIASGTPREVSADPAVIEAYLGAKDDAARAG